MKGGLYVLLSSIRETGQTGDGDDDGHGDEKFLGAVLCGCLWTDVGVSKRGGGLSMGATLARDSASIQ